MRRCGSGPRHQTRPRRRRASATLGRIAGGQLGQQVRIGGRIRASRPREHPVDVGGRGSGGVRDQAPAAAEMPDQGGRGRGRAEVEGKERSRLAGHPAMLPGPNARRRARSGVPGDLLVRILQPLDELLDAEVVGQDLVATGTSPPKTPRSTGSKKTIALLPSGRYGRLACRNRTAGAVRPRSWISRATCSTRSSRCSSERPCISIKSGTCLRRRGCGTDHSQPSGPGSSANCLGRSSGRALPRARLGSHADCAHGRPLRLPHSTPGVAFRTSPR